MNMSFREWIAREAWAPQTSNRMLLSKHLSKPAHSVLDVWHHFASWGGAHEIADDLGMSLQDLRNDDIRYEIAEKIDSYMDAHPGLWERLHDYVMARRPEDAPTTSHMTPERELPRDTWLVHFSDHAREISAQGFRIGEPDVAMLGLTRFRNQDAPGYNFAFVAGSRHSRQAAARSKYGSDAVMFMAPAHLVWHFGDEEEQAIFDGESVRPADIVLVTRDRGDGGEVWTVRSRREGARDPYRSYDFAKAEAWVMQNWRQYMKVIMSRETEKTRTSPAAS